MSRARSQLLELLDKTPSREILSLPEVDQGIAEVEPFPFPAIVGQREMKLALVLTVINPQVGGVLLIGSRGTAKTTAVRSLIDLLPTRRRSLCPHGCTEELLAQGGMAAICKDCATRVGYGQPLTVEDRVRLMELPLNARLEDVVGGINERVAMEQQRVRLERGILAQADGNILYIDEVNLLDDGVTDAILDAAAQGYYIVRRGALNLSYRSRFVLIGSMNPEEGRLRPQIMDRFGLRAIVRGLAERQDRYLAYQQAIWYSRDPDGLAAAYAPEVMVLADEIEQAKQRLPAVTITGEARDLGLRLVEELQIDSSRAEISLFEAARAHAAADEREQATAADVRTVALLALRQRQSPELRAFFESQQSEDERLLAIVDQKLDPEA
jgi:magnesium chelatase subunit I